MSQIDSLSKLRLDLQAAAQFLREHGSNSAPIEGLEKSYDEFFAEHIERLAEQLDPSDEKVLEELWGIFAPTCSWDDANGDAQIANQIFSVISGMVPPFLDERLKNKPIS
jgi:hypothetical protein